MKFLFSKSTLILSKAIRWGLNEPVSHFALQFGPLVVHSNLLGVQVTTSNEFRKHAEIIYELKHETTKEKHALLFLDVCNFVGRPYDWGAFIYFIWRAILWRLFKNPIPKRNPWGDRGAFLCTEIYTIVASHLPGVQAPQDLDLVSPYKLYLILKESNIGQSNDTSQNKMRLS